VGALLAAIVCNGGAVAEWDRREAARMKREAIRAAAPATETREVTDVRKDEAERAAAFRAIDAADFASLSAARLEAFNTGGIPAAIVARRRKDKADTLDDLRRACKHRFVAEAVAAILAKGGER
jgi:hypothetical protein